jgi:hypothetical protein
MANRNSGADLSGAELRQRITELVEDNAVAMVQCAIDSVMEQGQYQAIKYLFEMVGIYPATAGDSDEPEDGLSKLLLKHLGIDAPENATGPERAGSIP